MEHHFYITEDKILPKHLTLIDSHFNAYISLLIGIIILCHHYHYSQLLEFQLQKGCCLLVFPGTISKINNKEMSTSYKRICWIHFIEPCNETNFLYPFKVTKVKLLEKNWNMITEIVILQMLTCCKIKTEN